MPATQLLRRTLLLACLLALMPALCWSASVNEAEWLERIRETRRINDPRAAGPALAALAAELPTARSPQLEYQWLSLQLGVARSEQNLAEVQRLTDLLQAHADQHNLLPAKIEVASYRAEALRSSGKAREGLELMAPWLLQLDQLDDLRVRYLTHNRVALLYTDLSEFENALSQHLKALAIAEQSGPERTDRELLSLNNLGGMYMALRQPEQALIYLDRALPLADANNARQMKSGILLNKGNALAGLARYDEARLAYETALQLARENGDKGTEATALINVSDAALQRKQFDEAIDAAQQGLLLSEQLDLANNVAIARTNLGLGLAGKGMYRQGLQYLHEAQQAFQQMGDPASEDMIVNEIANAAERAGDFETMAKALRQQATLREQLYSDSRQRAITQLQQQFDAEARQRQFELLERENDLQAAEIEKRRLYLWIGGLVSLVVVLAAALTLFSYRRVRDANQKLAVANAKLADQSNRDPLTGLFNRRSFQQAMERRRKNGERRSQRPADEVDALVLLDVDHFKKVNDSYGHPAGDAVLIEVAQRLQAAMRDSDMVLRWGGEEFLLYLRASSLEALPAVVTRVLAIVGQTVVSHEELSIPVTISAGFVPLPFAGLAETEFDWEKAMQLADMALYLSKRNGRNRAFGVLGLNASYGELAAQLEQDLGSLIDSQKVIAVEVLGPGAYPAKFSR